MSARFRCLFAAAALTLAACAPVSDVREASSANAPASPYERGRAIYNYRCYFCHGYSGDAKTAAAQMLDPPPRDFTRLVLADRGRDAMLATVRDGRPGTGMASFRHVLNDDELALVVDFVREAFMTQRSPNTRYHTVENGWPEHDKHAAAFPFATGKLSIDTPVESLDASARQGRALFLSTCISCHEPHATSKTASTWQPRPVTYPPDMYLLTEYGRTAPQPGLDPHELHEKPPVVANLTKREARGEKLYQANCAHCHAADGTGRGWRGAFIEPHPVDFAQRHYGEKDRAALGALIARGIAGTPMPAWQAVLTRDEIDAVTAYMVRAFGGGALTQQAAAR